MELSGIIEHLAQRYVDLNEGVKPNYIPELNRVDGRKFGIGLREISGSYLGFGDHGEKFSIQSIVKVLSLTLAYKRLGEDLWKRVGIEPSGSAFNSLVLLEQEQGVPRNPFINAGALVVADVLVGLYEDPEQAFLDFIRGLCGDDGIHFDENIAASEKAHGHLNAALTHFMKSFGNIRNEQNKVLDFYFKICSITMTCRELATTFLMFANNGVQPLTGEEVMSSSMTKRVNAIMLLCGFYNEAGEFAFRVGLPAKSGVGGGIIAIHPERYSIAVWSPLLNDKGNSLRGFRFLEDFTTATSSIF
jgi:glutaminase